MSEKHQYRGPDPLDRADPRSRYQSDVTFHQLVDALAAMIYRCDYTPSEIREAAMLAAVIVETRKPRGPWILSRDEAAHFGIEIKP